MSWFHRRQTLGERGAAMVEFALVIPLFLALLFGIIEFGVAFRSKLIVDDGVQAATRVGAAVGNGLDVDLFVLEELAQQVSKLPNGGIGILSHVEIYKVNADGSPNLAKLNRYFYEWTADLNDCDWNPCPEGTAGYNGWAWRPDERNVAVGNLDQIGVKAYYSHQFLTGFLPIDDPLCDTPAGNPTNCWTEDAILRLEPLQFSVGS